MLLTCSPTRSDIYSLALTAVSSLLRKYSIDPRSIGRMEVGTETILDKSKSVKSVLMQLFTPSGNTNVEGVDTINACYGGTNALFNAVNWVESSAWDGRDAIVVGGDIALYNKGNARPTGGAGCVAMLVGPHAPLVVEPSLRGTYIIHAYDFYKPDLTSEYPIVDGHFSLRSYAQAMDACYAAYNERESKRKEQQTRLANGNATNGDSSIAINGATSDEKKNLETPLDRFDYMCFHSPTCKTVTKSYARLMYSDFRADPTNPLYSQIPQELATLDHTASLTDKNVEKLFLQLAAKRFATRVQPSIFAPTMCGNMYCASLYSSLCSLLCRVPLAEMHDGKRIGMFSYGSGLASSFFSLRVNGDVSELAGKLDLEKRLEARQTVEPKVYDESCDLREAAHLQKGYEPKGEVDNLSIGTYYLTKVDDMFRRSYEVKK